MAHEFQDANDKMWPPHVEHIFIEIMVEKQIKGNMKNGVLKGPMWEAMTQELNKMTGKLFTTKKFFQKHNRLQGKQRKWSQLLNHMGLGWDEATQIVTCTDEVLGACGGGMLLYAFQFHVGIVCLCIVVITLLLNNCFYAYVVVG